MKLKEISRFHPFTIDNHYFLVDTEWGSLFRISETLWNLLKSYLQDKDYSDKEIPPALKELKYLEEKLPPPFPIKKLSGRPEPVKALCLHLAHDCNLVCEYCFAYKGALKGKRMLMSIEIAKEAIHFLINNSGNTTNCEIDFFGGEPLLNFTVIEKIVPWARDLAKKKSKKINFTLTTNGTLLNKRIIDFLNRENIFVILSLDGPPAINDRMRKFPDGRGTYHYILPRFQELVNSRNNKDYYIRGTFTAYSLYFSSTVDYLANLGFRYISIEPVVAWNTSYALTEEHIPIIEKEYEKLVHICLERKSRDPNFSFFHFQETLRQSPCIKKRITGCGAGVNYFAVTPEGELYPCHQLVGEEQFLMGDIFQGIKSEKLRDNFSKATVLDKIKCQSCWARFYCGGGCHANAYFSNRDILTPYHLGCELQKKRIECALYLAACEIKKGLPQPRRSW